MNINNINKQINIAKIISNSLQGIISEHEEFALQNWLNESPSNKFLYNRLLEEAKLQHKLIDYKNIDVAKAKKKVENRNKNNLLKIRIKKKLKYVALIIVIICSVYFYQVRNKSIQSNNYSIQDGNITLQLEDGNVEVITNNGDRKILNKLGKIIGEQKGDRINYNNNNDIKKLAYNKLVIPYGKMFSLTLSDGTEVFLNSGSSLKYPIKFINGDQRKVYLEGEAFFKVKSNKRDPFIVVANNLNTKVYGTSFNISSYENDKETKVVLVEGKVGLFKKDSDLNGDVDIFLNPNQLGSLKDNLSNIELKKVETYQYTSWIDNTLIFKSESFENIFKKLERHYNVKINCDEKSLVGEKFTGTFHKKDIEYIMKIITTNIDFEYELVNLN